ncbi:putative Ras-related protein Rab-4B [Paratrimastix pyriformis]|uniref:Ras-related protein Rab-4B n=1 Tax=Paratrimastix pyriformis TaxID=342808 RepID=A0ABQ8UA74_9EUKA|nr:putative Ras-related protein Rab-4B [Paratrimastix pyriformis]|eukprot:GAFH01004405.1.p1 GENE.GAFH01004405.1~~GAFH01004405.1.p1  ORF type:complete len:237 (+),score=19.93 GAFH01004405.1:32-742(+)
MASDHHVCLKVIIIGDAGTGKTAMLHRFVEDSFVEDTTHTVGVEYGSKIVTVGDTLAKLQIWDTAGQERFKSVTHAYYRESIGCILVYDITSRESFNHIASWLTDCKTLAHPQCQIILVGNKADLSADREVTFMEATRFAQENELLFVETSAATGQNVEETFLKASRAILTKIDDGTIPPESFGVGIQYPESSPRRKGGNAALVRRTPTKKGREADEEQKPVIDLRNSPNEKPGCC